MAQDFTEGHKFIPRKKDPVRPVQYCNAILRMIGDIKNFQSLISKITDKSFSNSDPLIIFLPEINPCKACEGNRCQQNSLVSHISLIEISVVSRMIKMAVGIYY